MSSLILSVEGKKPARECLLTIKTRCPHCDKRNMVTIWETTYKRIMAGEPTPHTPEDRALIKTGLCHACYNKIINA